MQIEHRKIVDLKPYERNSRTHSKDQIKKVADSIREFGFTNPVLIRDDGTILAGHGRVEAAKLLGMSEVPCIQLSHLTPAQARAYVIADNALAELSGWDEDLLKREIAELKTEDFNLDVLGLENLDNILAGITGTEGKTDPDEVPPVPEIPVTKPGDMWMLGPHRLLCGDATKAEDAAHLMDGQLADMIFTDPPYGVSYQEKAKDLNARIGTGINEGEITNDTIDLAAAREIWRLAFENYHRSTSHFASYYCTAPQGGDQMMMMMMIEVNWQVKHELMWVKDSLVLGRADYHYQHEPIIYGWKKKKTHHFYGDRSQTSVWHCPRPKKSDLHPTMKPVELIERAIHNSSKTGQVVADFFLGSGSTLIACEKTGRICYGMEIDPHYCDVIVKRWEDFTGKKAMLEARG